MAKKLYRPVIVKKEVDQGHHYYVDGKFFPGVTTILHETLPMPFALKYWLGEVGNEKAQAKLKRAGDRGTKIHQGCEDLLRGKTVRLHDKFPQLKDQKCLISFIDWMNKAQPVYDEKYIEFTIASKHGFAGTLDFFCYINKVPWIIDFKTSAGIYTSHMLQLTAYRYAFREMTGINAKMAILHLNYRTKRGWSFVDKIEIKKTPVKINNFLKVFKVYKMLNGGIIPEPKIIETYPSQIKLYDNNHG